MAQMKFQNNSTYTKKAENGWGWGVKKMQEECGIKANDLSGQSTEERS